MFLVPQSSLLFYNLPVMKLTSTIVLIGAGKSATVLIEYLLAQAEDGRVGWKVIIADADRQLAEEKTKKNPLAEIVVIDIMDPLARQALVSRADVVISMMPPALHILVARDCLAMKKHLLTASYADEEIKLLDEAILENDLLFLYEMGLDPGIDHMSAMQILDGIKMSGGNVTSFKSHCGGLVAPESDDNPWHYKITWNPRNVVLAGKSGAEYKMDGKLVRENYEELFNPSRLVDLAQEGLTLSYYPNRDSYSYINLYGLECADTFIRTTLRYPDFMYGWKNMVDLKFTSEEKSYDSTNKTLQDFFRDHLEKNGFGEWLQQMLKTRYDDTKELLDNLMKMMEAEEAAAKVGEEIPDEFLMVDETGDLKKIEIDKIKNFAATTMAQNMHEATLILKQLSYLGFEDPDTLLAGGFQSPAEVLQFALEKKLALLPGDKDMIVMLHEIEYMVGAEKFAVNSSLIVKGNDHVHTAMAKTVGLPLGIAAKLLLNGSIRTRGLQVPVSKEIYEPVLHELNQHGICFKETTKGI